MQLGQEALLLARAPKTDQVIVEDLLPDPNQLQVAHENFEVAVSLFKVENRKTDEARATIELAEVFFAMPPSNDVSAQVEARCRAALDLLDTIEEPATSLKAFVLLGQAMALRIAHTPEGFEKESLVKSTLGVLHAGQYLSAKQNDSLLGARVYESLSRVLGEKFGGDRDANLLDAIQYGRRALPALKEAQHSSPLDYPSLQVHIGNCFMKLDGPRMRWLREAASAYKEGALAVDSRQAPRLQRVLNGNAAMAEALVASGDSSLPDMEMMARFGASLQSALDQGDMERGKHVAWETLQWAWSLSRTPNVWIAEAHKIFGSLLCQGGDAEGACEHFYAAAALLYPLAASGNPRDAELLQGAKQLLSQAMKQVGREGQTAELLERAVDAFQSAHHHCELGSKALEENPKAAYDEFEQALALFPIDPIALFYRGVALAALSQLDAACRDFEAVICLQPRNFRALVNRAQIKTQLGDTQGALTDYGLVLESDPDNVPALYNRSMLRVAAAEYELAVKDLDRLIATHSDLSAAQMLRAKCVEHLGCEESKSL